MILLAAAFLAGDFWTWDVTLRYDDAEGPLLVERERWSVRIGQKQAVKAERLYLGSIVDGTLIPSSADPESLKGEVTKDGTLSLKGDWSDPDTAQAFRKLLKGDKSLPERIPNWPVLRRGTLVDPKAHLPGSGLPARLTIEVILSEARLGGQDIKPLAK
ncbi:hypothetical protein EON82_16590 [bacterium]|nr:MAG: hypothetical protein EON82_16590 [bacterium]